MAVVLLTEETKWWRDHPEPGSTVSGNTLTLWNYPVGGVGLAPEHAAAIDEFLFIERHLAAERIVLSVRGHASPTGENTKNSDLALARAQGVRAHLLGLGVKDITLSAAGANEPVDGDRSGPGLSQDRRVVVVKFNPAPEQGVGPFLDEPPAPRPTPATSDALKGIQAEGVVAKIGPVNIMNSPCIVDVSMSGTFKAIAQNPTGALVGGLAVGADGTLSGKVEVALIKAVATKFTIEPPKGGAGAPTIKAGAQFKEVAGKPEIGVQKPPKFVYIKFTIVDRLIVDDPRDPNSKITFKGDIQFDIGPGAEMVKQLARLETALGGTTAAEGFTAAELQAAGIGGGGTVSMLAAVSGAIGVAAVINGGVIYAVQNAKAEADRFTALLARRDGKGARVAWAIIGNAAEQRYLERERQWLTGRWSAPMLDAFRQGRRDVEALLRDEKLRVAKVAAWKATYAADGTMDFAVIRNRVYEGVGGIDKDENAGASL